MDVNGVRITSFISSKYNSQNPKAVFLPLRGIDDALVVHACLVVKERYKAIVVFYLIYCFEIS